MNVFFHKCFCYLLVWLSITFYHADLFVVGFNSTGKLSSSVNVVDMRLVSRRGLQKVGSGHRCFRVHALFGGKKDNEGPVSFSINVTYEYLFTLATNLHCGSMSFVI